MEPEERSRTCILVLGMHRGGTSALTRAISYLGAELPATLMPPGPDNVHGFWESDRIVPFNEQLLFDAGSNWDDFRAVPPDWIKQNHSRYAPEIHKLVASEFGEAERFILKDPRISRIVPIWDRALSDQSIDCVYAIPVRSPLAVAESLRRRDNFPYEKSFLLWLRHMLDAERLTRERTRSFVLFDDLLARAEVELRRVWSELVPGAPRVEEAALEQALAFLDGDSATSNAAADLDQIAPGWVSEVYLQLRRHVAGKALDKDLLDEVADDFRLAELGFSAGRRETWKRNHPRFVEADERDRAERASEALREKIETMRSDRDQAKREVSRLETDIGDFRDRASRLENEKADLESRVAAYSDIVEELSASNSGLSREFSWQGVDHEEVVQTLKDQLCAAEVASAVTARSIWPWARASSLVAGHGDLRVLSGPRKIWDALLFAIDGYAEGSRGVRIHGWAYHPEAQISDLQFVSRQRSGIDRIAADHTIPRQDVVDAHGAPEALHSGFVVMGRLDEPPREAAFYLRLKGVGSSLIKIDRVAHRNSLGGARTAAFLARRRLRISGSGLPGILRRAFKSLRLERRHNVEPGEDDLLAELAESGRPVEVVFDHDMGGGSTTFRKKYVEAASGKRTVLQILMDLNTAQHRVQIVRNGALSPPVELDAVELLGSLDRSNVEVAGLTINNLYGFIFVEELVEALVATVNRLDADLKLFIHDYFPVCPSYNLLNQAGQYCGIPKDLDECRLCLRFNDRDFGRCTLYGDIASWRRSWARLIDRASEIECMSDASAALMRRGFPGTDPEKFAVRPPEVDHLLLRPVKVANRDSTHVGVIGNISYQKGASVVAEIAKLRLEPDHKFDLSIVGSIDAGGLDDGVTVTGPYDPKSLPNLIEDLGVNVVLFPSIWPETFSYVTTEVMSMGLPILAFDIGAPAERIARYEHGRLLPLGSPADSIIRELMDLKVASA